MSAAAALMFATFGALLAQSPALEPLRSAAEALAERDAARFLNQFDPAMKGYETLREQVGALVAADGAASTLEIVSEQGDQRRKTLEIDWLLRVGPGAAKRRILKFVVERQSRAWKITSLDAVEFFRKE